MNFASINGSFYFRADLTGSTYAYALYPGVDTLDITLVSSNRVSFYSMILVNGDPTLDIALPELNTERSELEYL